MFSDPIGLDFEKPGLQMSSNLNCGIIVTLDSILYIYMITKAKFANFIIESANIREHRYLF